MGNFEVNEPTEAQLNALTKLSVALMIKYKINPDSEIYAHIEDDHEPYVKDVVRTSFMGHRDTGKTACPGKNLYNKLPLITQAIRTQLLIQKETFPIKKVKKIITTITMSLFEQDNGSIIIPQSNMSKITTCKSYNTNITISSCKKQNDNLVIQLKKKKDKL
jgi:N-acetylmuramoyl-L-alanine amidase